MNRLKRRGSTAVMALGAMMILLIVTLGVSGAAVNTMRRSAKDRQAFLAFQAAQAGLELSIARAVQDMGADGAFVQKVNNISSDVQSFTSTATGTGRVDPQAGLGDYAWITSTVTVGGSTRSVRSLVSAKDVSIWNNAIFAGTGASGKSINGNVDIRGSVHLLGDGESYSDLNGNAKWDAAETFTDKNANGRWDPGEPFVDANNDGTWNPAEPYNDTNKNGYYDPPLSASDMNSTFGGNAYIGNNYSGMPLDLQNLVPNAPRVNGIETLNTNVRVKHGKISISGSASIGTSSVVDGGTRKGKIDGCFVNDGFAGSNGSTAVHSDNGVNNAYDLNHLDIKFPLIHGVGAEAYKDKTGTVWTTHQQFFDSRALTVPVSEITKNTSNFSYGPDAYGNSISWDSSTDTLTIQGLVKINGDIQIGSKSGPIRYDGSGTIYATNDIYVDGDFLPVSGKPFPTGARAGLVAKNNMHLATGPGSSQLSMAGAFYAQNTIVSRKQNQIAGTFVANYYDMGTNVPNIYQVPSLTRNMPPGMPGDRLMFTVKTHSWRERKAN